MQDRIDKTIDLAAPVSRVWRALTDYREFGAWFRVDLSGPFLLGEMFSGITTYPGYEGHKWEGKVVALEPERRFAFEWPALANDANRPFAEIPKNLVEFRLEPTAGGTRLHISESGFASLPDGAKRNDALRSNTEGWNIQANNIANYVRT